jgi:hypothetical protein
MTPPVLAKLSAREKRKIRLEVVNPLTPEGNRLISLYHVERYIRQGRAMIDQAGRVVFMCNSPARVIDAERALRGRAYINAALTGFASLEALRNTPVVMAEKLMIVRSRSAT